MTLLKNKGGVLGEGVLPLDATKRQTLLLLGAHANYIWPHGGLNSSAACATKCTVSPWGPSSPKLFLSRPGLCSAHS